MTAHRNIRRLILALISAGVVIGLCLATAVLSRGEEAVRAGGERLLLCSREEGFYYKAEGSQYWNVQDTQWNALWVWMDDQVSRPQEIRFYFSQDVEHTVFAVDQNRQLLWMRTFGRGLHSFQPDGKEAAVCFSVMHSEEEELMLSGTGMHARLETALTGKRLSVLGDSISAYYGYIPMGQYACYSENHFSVKSMWWAVLAEKTGMELCEINAVSGSGVTRLSQAADDKNPLWGNSVRCKELSAGGRPDEILILLGANDYMSGVPVNTIEREYLEMLAKIKEEYPDANVYACTYYECPAFGEGEKNELNALIRRAAEQGGVGLIDLEGCGIRASETEKYLMDGYVHPNEKGQLLMGIHAAGEMLKKVQG